MLAQSAETSLVAASMAEQTRVKAEAATIDAEIKAAERAEMRRNTNSTYSSSSTSQHQQYNVNDNDMPGIINIHKLRYC
jgi:hypothetical protein